MERLEPGAAECTGARLADQGDCDDVEQGCLSILRLLLRRVEVGVVERRRYALHRGVLHAEQRHDHLLEHRLVKAQTILGPTPLSPCAHMGAGVR